MCDTYCTSSRIEWIKRQIILLIVPDHKNLPVLLPPVRQHAQIGRTEASKLRNRGRGEKIPAVEDGGFGLTRRPPRGDFLNSLRLPHKALSVGMSLMIMNLRLTTITCSLPTTLRLTVGSGRTEPFSFHGLTWSTMSFLEPLWRDLFRGLRLQTCKPVVTHMRPFRQLGLDSRRYGVWGCQGRDRTGA